MKNNKFEKREGFDCNHECSKCKRTACPMRQKNISDEKMEIISSYEGNIDISEKSIICVDIGTTTVVFEYFKNGKRAGIYSAANPQRRFGADVISRISSANSGHLIEMKNAIVELLIKGVKELCHNSYIDEMVISANTTMVHLLMGYSCEGLGKYPFNPYSVNTVETEFSELTNSWQINFPVTIIGGIGAYVGGDIVSGILYTDMTNSDEICLFADLGTNGEIVMGNREKLIAVSAPAGPAFEGGGIECGMPCVDGAVWSVDLKNGTVKTINSKPPIGICGSGIVEAVSQMYSMGIVDETGLIIDEYFESGYPVCDGVKITQNDIRQIQMAKAAIRTGIDILAEEFGIEYEDIKKVYLGGGFGKGINIYHAANIGIIPHELLEKAVTVGNCSLAGAVKVGFSERLDGINRIKSLCKEIPLAMNDNFNQKYIENINF